MIISIIAALSENFVLGKDNKLLWHLPADFKRLRELTMGKPLIMGRKTFEAIGKPLPGRENIVISANPDFKADGIILANSLQKALSLVDNQAEVFIFGGATIYAQALALTTRMYLTIVKHHFEGDTFFPQWDPDEWQIVSCASHAKDAQNKYDYDFLLLERKTNR